MKIKTLLHTLVGLPWDDKKTISETVNFIKTLNSDFFEVRYCIPYPGTELERLSKEMGLLPQKVITNYDYSGFVPRTLHLDEKQLSALRQQALLKLLFRPGYIIKTLLSNPSPVVIFNYILFGIKKIITVFRPKREQIRMDLE